MSAADLRLQNLASSDQVFISMLELKPFVNDLDLILSHLVGIVAEFWYQIVENLQLHIGIGILILDSNVEPLGPFVNPLQFFHIDQKPYLSEHIFLFIVVYFLL